MVTFYFTLLADIPFCCFTRSCVAADLHCTLWHLYNKICIYRVSVEICANQPEFFLYKNFHYDRNKCVLYLSNDLEQVVN